MFVPSAASWTPSPLAAAEKPSSGPPQGATPVQAGPRSWRLGGWDRMSNPEKIALLSDIARRAGDDPRLRRLAVRIFRAAGVGERDYRGQAAAILRAVEQGVYFVNEQNEVLQDPAYTLDIGTNGDIGPDAAGDCDDHTTAVAALCRSVHLPVRLVTSGRDRRGRVVRFVEGQRKRAPSGVEWGHIYNAIGNHPFHPTQWAFADATVPGAPLGWDVVGARGSDPQRDLGAGELGDTDTIAGVSLRTAASLVGVSVASHMLIKFLERRGFI